MKEWSTRLTVKKLYTSDWHEDQIGVIDVKTLAIIKKIPTESKPDGSAYAAPFHKLYVSDETAKAVAVVDTTRDEVLQMLRFDSETGMPQYDPVAKKIYVNLQDLNIFAVIDPENDQLVGMHPVRANAKAITGWPSIPSIAGHS